MSPAVGPKLAWVRKRAACLSLAGPQSLPLSALRRVRLSVPLPKPATLLFQLQLARSASTPVKVIVPQGWLTTAAGLNAGGKSAPLVIVAVSVALLPTIGPSAVIQRCSPLR